MGIYVWTARPVAARRIEVGSPTPGYTARVYGASNTIPSDIEGWGRPIARLKGDGQRLRATLPGRRYSHYLIWITDLPPQGLVEIGGRAPLPLGATQAMSSRPRSGRMDMLIDHTDRPADVLIVPPALADRLDSDEQERRAFERLTYAQQRAYVRRAERASRGPATARAR